MNSILMPLTHHQELSINYFKTILTSGHPPLYHGHNAGSPTAFVRATRRTSFIFVRWERRIHLLATIATLPETVARSSPQFGSHSVLCQTLALKTVPNLRLQVSYDNLK